MRIDDIPNLYLTQTASFEASKPEQASFASWLGGHISNTNDKLNQADLALTQLATGQSSNLHQSMLSLEEAKLSFQFLEQIRNRLMTAYQELMKEQI